MQKKDLDALLTTENLPGLTPVFSAPRPGPGPGRQAGLQRRERPARRGAGPHREPHQLRRDGERPLPGRRVRQGALRLGLRRRPAAGRLPAARRQDRGDQQGPDLRVRDRLEAKETFTNNNLFRQASFRPKKGRRVRGAVKAAEAFKDAFGSEVKELASGAIVAEHPREVATTRRRRWQQPLGVLTAHRLPGGAVLERAAGPDEGDPPRDRGQRDRRVQRCPSLDQGAIKRAAELDAGLGEPQLDDLARAREALAEAWPFLKESPTSTTTLRCKADALADMLQARDVLPRSCPRSTSTRRPSKASTRGATRPRIQDGPRPTRPRSSSSPELPAGRTSTTTSRPDRRARFAAGRIRPRRAWQSRCSELKPSLPSSLRSAAAEVRRSGKGERVVSVNLASYFAGGIETEEQLDAALDGIREECARLIGAGKKVLVE